MKNYTQHRARRAALGALALIATAGAGLMIAHMSAPTPAMANSGGKVGFSGNPDEGGRTCGQCHGGGSTPTVSLDGPQYVMPGETHAYTLTIEGGQEIAGGLGVSVGSGVFAALAGATDLEVKAGEVIHTGPKPADDAGRIAFSFLWTAPDEPSQVSLYGAGNSVNLNGSPVGDGVAAVELPVTVSGGVSPTATQEAPTEPPPTETPEEPTATEPAATDTPSPEPTNGLTATPSSTPADDFVILLPRLHNSE